MKQVTLEIDDATFHSAATKARQAGTSLSAVVIDFLRQFSGAGGSDFEQLEVREKALRQQLQRRGASFSAGDRLTRDELYERHALP
jgi:hypothetical protein